MWPQVDGSVVLVRRDGLRCPSRVTGEDEDGSLLAVARPADADWRSQVQVGDLVQAQWHSPRGLHSMLAQVRAAGAGPWWLQPTQEPRVRERRAHVRAPAREASVEVAWADGAHPAAAGTVLDLGEGGVRVRLAAGAPVAPAEAASAVIEGERASAEVDGVVLRTHQVLGGTEVVIAFARPTGGRPARVRRLVLGRRPRSRR